MARSASATPFRLSPSPSETELLAKYFRAFGDPIRLRILELLEDGEASVGQLVAALDLPQPNVSNHLACLRWCGFVESRREHRTVRYRVADERVLSVVRLASELLCDSSDRVASATGSTERRMRRDRSGGVTALGVAAFAVICCAAFPILAALLSGIAAATALGAVAGVAVAVAVAVLGARARRNGAGQTASTRGRTR